MRIALTPAQALQYEQIKDVLDKQLTQFQIEVMGSENGDMPLQCNIYFVLDGAELEMVIEFIYQFIGSDEGFPMPFDGALTELATYLERVKEDFAERFRKVGCVAKYINSINPQWLKKIQTEQQNLSDK